MFAACICEQARPSRRYVHPIFISRLFVSNVLPYAAMSPAEVTEKLGLHRMRDRSWYVHPRLAFNALRLRVHFELLI